MRPARYMSLVLATITTVCTGAGSAQDFPSKPIRVFTGGVGGSADLASRQLASGLGAAFGQQVVVENRPAPVAIEAVLKSPPDGYTLITSGSSFITAHLLQPSPYDPLRDFVPVTLVSSSPNVLTVHPTLPVKSVKELIALAKNRPGELNYASGTTGSSNHLSAEFFKSLARVNIVRVTYKFAVAAVSDVITGQVQVAFYGTASVTPHVKSGKLRALAVTSSKPSALVPGLPTVAATGLPGYEVLSVDSVYAPARTPAPIISRLNQEMVRVLIRPEIKERFLNTGNEVVANSPEEAGTWLKAEIVKWGKLIKEAGIRAD